MPFGGFKQSGFGRDKSLHALDGYTQLKTTWFDLSGSVRRPHRDGSAPSRPRSVADAVVTAGTAGPSAAASRSSGRGPSRGCATARPRSCRPTSSSRSTSPRCASSPRSGWTSSTPRPASSCAAAGADVDAGRRSGSASTPTMVIELITTAPSTVHAPRPEPGPRPPASAATGSRSGRWRARRTSSDLDRGRRIGNRADYQNLLRLRPVAQRRPLPGRLPGRAGRPPPRRPPPRRDLRRADADGQADPRLQPRPPAQHRRARDGPHRPRHRRRDARARAVDLHGRQLELAAAARRADAPGDHGVRGAQPGRRASRRSRWPGRWRR